MARSARTGGRVRAALLLWALLGSLGAWAAGVGQGTASMATDFWLAFPPNFTGQGAAPVTLTLRITSVSGASGTVSAPSGGWSVPFTVGAGGETTVTVPDVMMLGDGSGNSQEVEEQKALEVVSDQPVAVYAMNNEAQTSDGFLPLPVFDLGTEYYALSYGGGTGTEFGVAAIQDGTVLSLTLPYSTLGHTAGVPFNPVAGPLGKGDTYFLLDASSGGDFTGTHILSNNPVAVVSGNTCAYVPAADHACDVLLEELFPVPEWGQEVLSQPLATRSNGDTFRVLASQNGTQVTVNGGPAIALNAGQFSEMIESTASEFSANAPILVGQYSNGLEYDGQSQADPSEEQLLCTAQYSQSYLVSPDVGDFFPNYVNLVAPASQVGVLTVNGAVVPAASFSAIGGSGYSAASVQVNCAVCLISGTQPFGAQVYGFTSANAYSLPAGIAVPNPLPTSTSTPLYSPTISPTFTVSETFTISPTFSVSPTVTPTYSASPTATPTPPPFALNPGWPNPDPSGADGVWLPYTVTTAAWVDFRVFDVSGELVRSFAADPEAVAEGSHERFWDGKNSYGRAVASGVYLVRVHAAPALSGVGPEQVAWMKCAVAR